MKKLNFLLIGLVILSLFAGQVSASTTVSTFWEEDGSNTGSNSLTVGLGQDADFFIWIQTTNSAITYSIEVLDSDGLQVGSIAGQTITGSFAHTDTLTLNTSIYSVGDYTVRVLANNEDSNDLYLTIVDNHAPNAPSNPNPADGATDVDVNPTLAWEASDVDGDNLTYTVYLNSDDGISTDTKSLYVSNLSYETTYSWYVVVADAELSTTSNTWTFTTGSETVLNDVPVISNIPDQAVYCGDEFSYQVVVTDDGNNLTYSDNTNLFDISSTGLISVNTLCDDVGNYDITITVQDEYGSEDTEEFRLTINDNDNDNDNDDNDDDDDEGVTFENQIVYGDCGDDNDGDNEGLRTVTLNVLNPFNGQIVSSQQIIQSCPLGSDTEGESTSTTNQENDLGIVLLVAFLVLVITVPLLLYFYYRYFY